MSKSCTILAHVRRPDGSIVESRLFSDLLHYTANNRELAKEYYAVGTNEGFLAKVRDSEEFQTDENGEITLRALRSLAKIDIETDKVIQVLNADIGQGEYPYDEALRKVREFNENNGWADRMLATMVPSGKGNYFVSVVPKTTTATSGEGREVVEGNTVNERKKLHDVVRNEEMERRIKALLRSHHVSVKFLEGDRQGGRYSTENVTAMENGLYGLIEINEAGHTTEVLAEEAGHFAVAALGDNPLVKRLESLLETPEAQREALGEEDFDNASLGKNPPREVAGKLVGRALLRKLEDTSRLNILANRIANIAKRAFHSFTGNEVRWAAAKAEQIANKIAYDFVEGNNSFSVENALNIGETMHNANLTNNQKAYRDAVDEMGRMVKNLEAIAQDQFTGQMQASLAMTVLSGTNNSSGESALQMVGATADVYAFDGIVQALVQVMDYLGPGKEIDQMLKAVDLKNPSEFYANMARNGRLLRQARVFLRSAEIMVDNINRVLNEDALGKLTLPNGSTLNDVRYQDEDGRWQSINLKSAIPTLKRIIYDTLNGTPGSTGLLTLEQVYFTRFCEDVYGNKYITTTTGKLWTDWKNGGIAQEERISIEDMITGEGMEDIDIFHRYLGSMSNNPDVIGQIVDKLVKTANKTADDETIKNQEQLIILEDRAKKLEINIEDLIERDDEGIPTGNMITPPASPTEYGNSEEDAVYEAYMAELGYSPAVHYGSWEKAREEFKKAMWEEFKNNNPGIESMSGFTKGYKWDAFLRPRMKKWNAENSIRVDIKDPQTGDTLYVKWVPNAIYASKQWDNLKAKYPSKRGANDNLDKWMHDFRRLKEKLDAKLPQGSTTSYRLPQFKGTFMNSVRNQRALEKGTSKNFNAWRKTVGRRVILESFVETSEDEDYGSLQTMNSPDEEWLGTRLNYEQEKAARLPIFGINKLKNMQDLSTDLFHSMTAYASMANSYQCLEHIVDSLEVGAEVLHERDIKGKKSYVEKASEIIGSTWRKATGKHATRYTGTKDRSYGRYLKYIDKQVYGISSSHFGFPIGKGKRVLLNKVIQNVSSLGGTIFLKGNVLGGAVNTLTGGFNVFKEAVSSEYFTVKDWKFAHAYYFNHFPELWTTELGTLKKNNKLSMFLTQMNTSNNNREKFRNWHTTRSRSNNIFRMAGYLPYSSGDHYMQAMSYLAVAHGTTLYDTNGNAESNLWDAFKRTDNTDDKGMFSSGSSIEFAKFCPLDASNITSEILQSKGVFLKSVTKSTTDFEDWLVYQDEQFADEVYKKDHPDEYNTYRDKYDALSDKEIMKFRAEKYKLLSGILQKTEESVSSSSPLIGVPSFTPEEEQYLRYKRIGTGNYSDILQAVREDIYKVIWTKSDESAYMDKCREINNRLHGIYNEQDKTSWHQNWYTNAFLAMKGWALGYLEMMYSNNHYSIALDRNVEGFVNTYAKIFANWVSGMFGNKNALGFWDTVISMLVPWHSRSMEAMQRAGFSKEQNFNARRAAASAFLMGLLLALRLATAPPDDEEEMDQVSGLVYYLAMRTLLEQEALLYAPEMFVQSGSLLDFMPVGGAALYDVGKLLLYETPGALIADEENSNFYWQKDDKNGKYTKHEAKAWTHFERLIPYYKSYWAIMHPYEAADNYEFGRKLRTR